ARVLLLRAADDARVPLADGQGRAALLALCDRLNRALGEEPPRRLGRSGV
ncbi:MAG: hypothetical protein JWM10_2837, partial [Myxococcaceae bacterium]|nr:hypothetical protein [Myxococcaceae bacterium]